MLSLRFPSPQTGQETKSEVSPPLEEKQTFKVSQDQVINFAVKINFQKNDFMEPSMFRPADSSRFPHFPGALQQSAPILLNLRTTVDHSGHLKPHKIKRNRNMFSFASDRVHVSVSTSTTRPVLSPAVSRPSPHHSHLPIRPALRLR